MWSLRHIHRWKGEANRPWGTQGKVPSFLPGAAPVSEFPAWSNSRNLGELARPSQNEVKTLTDTWDPQESKL
jgi:hypothetical protein